VIFTTDHGTFNGDHGRIGKLQTHEHDAKAHIPFILAHPTRGHSERRSQLVQLVDIYPTVLAAVDRPLPQMPPGQDGRCRPLHGVNLLPVVEDPVAHTRDFAFCGQFGHSVSITDGEWILHQSPVTGNRPLYWHGTCLARFLPYPLGPFEGGRRPVIDYRPWPTPTWLSDKRSDPSELVNLVEREPATLRAMQAALLEMLIQLQAPAEQIERLGLG